MIYRLSLSVCHEWESRSALLCGARNEEKFYISLNRVKMLHHNMAIVILKLLLFYIFKVQTFYQTQN